MEHLQSLHHLVSIAAVVVGSQVVYPAAQRLTGLPTPADIRQKIVLTFLSTSKNGSNQSVLPEAGAGLTRVWKYFGAERQLVAARW